MQATHTALLPFPKLSLAARCANLFSALQNLELISTGRLCDDGFAATFSKDHLTLVKQNFTITGGRNSSNSLYYIDLDPCPKPTVQNALSLPTSYARSA